MAVFRRGDRVSFTGSIVIEGLFGTEGVVVNVHRAEGHYVYSVRLSSRVNLPDILYAGIRLVTGNVLSGIPGDWIELISSSSSRPLITRRKTLPRPKRRR